MGITTYAFLEFSPIILDIVLPLSETRPRKLHVLTEYFVDDKTYFFPILCHWLTAMFLDFIIVVSTYMFHMMHTHHVCGLLTIAW